MANDPTDSTNDLYDFEKSTRRSEQELREKILLEMERRDWEFILGTEEGLRTIQRIIEECHPLEREDRMGAEAGIRQGEKNIGLVILQRVKEFCPGKLVHLMNFKPVLQSPEKKPEGELGNQTQA